MVLTSEYIKKHTSNNISNNSTILHQWILTELQNKHLGYNNINMITSSCHKQLKRKKP
uniref:Uncharacterized protein n=1 Tax=Arundo donax TaxID=35708 RepID=A0A0A8YER3_ARUDO